MSRSRPQGRRSTVGPLSGIRHERVGAPPAFPEGGPDKVRVPQDSRSQRQAAALWSWVAPHMTELRPPNWAGRGIRAEAIGQSSRGQLAGGWVTKAEAGRGTPQQSGGRRPAVQMRCGAVGPCRVARGAGSAGRSPRGGAEVRLPGRPWAWLGPSHLRPGVHRLKGG